MMLPIIVPIAFLALGILKTLFVRRRNRSVAGTGPIGYVMTKPAARRCVWPTIYGSLSSA